ncbi:MAG: hypothetical protein Q9173_002959 [Seirophora scorigena]
MNYPGPGGTIALVVGLTFMSHFFVLLKTYARVKTKVSFGIDDYLIYVCALLNCAYMAVNIWGTVRGNMGTLDLMTLPNGNLTIYLKVSSITSAVLYVIMITLAKFSVLCFYRRVFGKPIYLGTTFIFVLQTIWAIICVCLAIFRCDPIAGSWDVTLASKCISFETIVIAVEPFNCALDFAMVALPVRVIRTLQLPRKHKISISAIFLLGSFVGFMCILRIIYTERGNVDTSARWVYAQINVGIVCACLPTLKPILPKSGTVSTTVRNLVSSIRSSLRSTGSGEGQPTNGQSNEASVINRHDRYHNISRDAVDKTHLTQAIGGSEPFKASQDYPMHKIKVRHDVEIV